MTAYWTTLRGSLAPAQLSEIFTHGLAIESAANSQVVAEAVRDKWKLQWEGAPGLGSYFNPAVTYLEATAARIITPETGELAAAYHAPFSPTLPGSSGGIFLPSQLATVVSLTAGTRPNGTPLKGRFYLPGTTHTTLATGGVLTDGIRDFICDKAKAFIDSLNAAGHIVCVWSRTNEDLFNYVTQVRVGNKVDTMRSRRNKMPETYKVNDIIGPAR